MKAPQAALAIALATGSLALAACGDSPSAPSSPAAAASKSACDSSYPDFCIRSDQGDLDCAQVDGEDFAVVETDPHGFDGDGDGVGCES